MSALEDKYSSVIAAAKSAGISDLQVSEQDGILYISGDASGSAAKDAVWNALGQVDPTYSASDINVDVKVSGLAAGATLKVNTDSTALNLRAEPSTDAEVVGHVAHGGSVSLVEQTNDEWWKVKSDNGTEGYAYARYLQA